MKQNFQEVLISMVKTGNRQINFKDNLILDDNVGDEEQKGESSALIVLYDGQPVKLMFSMVFLCVHGTIHMRLNLRDYDVGPNEMLVVLPQAILDKVVVSSDAQLAVWAQSTDFYLPDNALVNKLLAAYTYSPWKISVPPCDVPQLLAFYRMVRQAMGNERLSYKTHMLNGFSQVLASYIMNYLDGQQMPQKKNVSRFRELYQRFLTLVIEYHAEERSVAFYADRMCITPKYLAVAVQQASGRTASAWIRDYVILDAKAMILSGNYTIQQVSDLLHFANPSFFGRYFKDAVGCAPGKFAETVNAASR